MKYDINTKWPVMSRGICKVTSLLSSMDEQTVQLWPAAPTGGSARGSPRSVLRGGPEGGLGAVGVGLT